MLIELDLVIELLRYWLLVKNVLLGVLRESFRCRRLSRVQRLRILNKFDLGNLFVDFLEGFLLFVVLLVLLLGLFSYFSLPVSLCTSLKKGFSTNCLLIGIFVSSDFFRSVASIQ